MSFSFDPASLPERVSNQTPMGRVLRFPLRLIPSGTVLPIMRGPARGMSWIAGSHTHGCWLGTYEINLQRRFEAIVGPGDVVYDVGAHVGLYSLMASSLVGPDGTVVAFEPSPRNLNYLTRHLSLNPCENVRVVEAACGGQDGYAAFEVNRDRHAQGRLSEGGELVVRTLTLDSALDELGVSPPDCLKVDVEGGELEVLRGGRRTIREHQPEIFLSLHSRRLHDECLDLLRGWGYSTVPLTNTAADRYEPEVLARAE